MQIKIQKCQRCPLYKNQEPSTNKLTKSDILILGISSQKNSKTKNFLPFDSSTNSGKFITKIEMSIPETIFYKTNLVKCAPLNSENKIRYPTHKEITSCVPNFKTELDIIKPKIIVPTGKLVTNFLSDYFGVSLKKYTPTTIKDFIIIPIDHPSYLMIYKRREIDKYKEIIVKLLKI